MRRKFLFLFGLAVVLAAQPLFAAKFKVDHAHTNIGFSVKHMVVAKTTGSFNDFTASLELDPADMSSFKVMATIQAASIDTRLGRSARSSGSPPVSRSFRTPNSTKMLASRDISSKVRIWDLGKNV